MSQSQKTKKQNTYNLKYENIIQISIIPHQNKNVKIINNNNSNKKTNIEFIYKFSNINNKSNNENNKKFFNYLKIFKNFNEFPTILQSKEKIYNKPKNFEKKIQKKLTINYEIDKTYYLNYIKNNENKLYIKDKYYNTKKGFYNFGNTCYMNSILQIIIHIPGFIEGLKKLKINKKINCLLNNLIDIADKPSNNGNLKELENLRIEFFFLNSNYKYYRQEDSQEFGSQLLKNLNNELIELNLISEKWNLNGFDKKNSDIKINNKINKLIELMKSKDCDLCYLTYINDYFFYYETELIICNDKIVNINFFGDVDIQLSFKKSINKQNKIVLLDMLKQKYFTGNNKLIKLPKVLNITLLRAIINEPLITTNIFSTKNIDLKEFLDNDFGNYLLPTEYKLYAFNVCKGKFKNFGHYYSYILINDEWYKFDDEMVNKVENDLIINDLPFIYGIYYINKKYLETCS